MEATTRVEAAAHASSDARQPRAAMRTLAVVAAVGVVVAGLTWRAEVGLGWLVADAVLVAAMAFFRRRPPLGALPLAGASLWLAFTCCWYGSDWAFFVAFPGSVVALGLAALVTARRIGARDLDRVAGASFDAVCELPFGFADAARTPLRAMDAGARGRATMILRGALVGVPLAGVFALLLSADAHFRGALGRLIGHMGSGVEFGVWTAATIAGLLVAHAVMLRLGRSREAAGAAGITAPWPYRVVGDVDPACAQHVAPAGSRVRPFTWGVVLVPVVAVFALYVAANGSTLFAGHAYLQARGTLSYAAYVHEGFAEVSVATLLAVACVVVGHVLMRPRVAGARVAGGRTMAAIEIALLALVAVTLASSAHRLALYEEAYGYTYLRLGVWLLQLGVAGLLVMTGARCIARAWRGWGAAFAWVSVAFACAAGSIDADGWIARRNVERARAGLPLDVDYLATLGADARSVLGDLRSIDPSAADALAATWADSMRTNREGDWRSRRGLGAR